MGTRSRAWCFTLNNYTDEDCKVVEDASEQCEFVAVGKEEASTGTPHLQGYLYFKNARTFSSVTKMIPRAHFEVSKGTPEQNLNYCSKSNLWIKKGSPPTPGKRTDIDTTIQQLKQGANMRDITEVPRSYQSVKMAEVWLKYHESPRDWKPEIRWYYGSTGSGKTRTAREWLQDDIYTALGTSRWWDGYDGHESVLIDDFRKDFAKFHELLRLFDRYEYRVEVKGGTRQFKPKKIAITSPYHPRDVYCTREDVNQLIRRIDQIILVGEEVTLFVSEDELEKKISK